MTIRIAMWSGPRNISTAMMRAFENRPDTAVVDEPFYAYYLRETGADHPLREAVLAAWPADPADIVAGLLAPPPGGEPIFYQKHMTHHMLAGLDLGFMAQCRNAFLIRPPEAVLASYHRARGTAALEEIGFVQQADLFARECDRLGQAPPVIAAERVLADPRGALSRLCAALDIPFSPAMLAWPAGPRDTDGPWAPAWYASVEASTGFGAPPAAPAPLSEDLKPIAEAARPYYERLLPYAL